MPERDKFSLNMLKHRMQGALNVLKGDFSGLRTGRASAQLLDLVMVEAYGSNMPLSQVGTISVPEARMLNIQVWDKALVPAVDKAIRTSNLGLDPLSDGQSVRVPIPELSRERRAELAKVASHYAEQSRIAVRQVRRDGMEQLRRLEKGSEISLDEYHDRSEDVQKLTDRMIREIDAILAHKETEIMQV
ncbi:MAG: ribosome recycling factor [Hyphomicrobiales bacterium]